MPQRGEDRSLDCFLMHGKGRGVNACWKRQTSCSRGEGPSPSELAVPGVDWTCSPRAPKMHFAAVGLWHSSTFTGSQMPLTGRVKGLEAVPCLALLGEPTTPGVSRLPIPPLASTLPEGLRQLNSLWYPAPKGQAVS